MPKEAAGVDARSDARRAALVPRTNGDSANRDSGAIGGGGGSRTRVRKIAGERDYRLSPTWNFAVAVKAGQNRRRLVRLISPSAYGPKARGQPTLMTLCPTAVGGQPAERVT